MLWFNKKKNELAKLDQLNSILKLSFQKVKQDTERTNQWLNYFYQKSIQQESQVISLQNQLQQIPKTPIEFKTIMDEIYHFEALDRKISEITQRIDNLYSQPTGSNEPIRYAMPNEKIKELQNRLEVIEAKKQSFKERIIKKIAKNSKDYIKSMIISYIKKYEKISAVQLKEMMVDEQKVCSKSSFYRILEEIESELEHEISTIKQGKEKHYLGKLSKRV